MKITKKVKAKILNRLVHGYEFKEEYNEDEVDDLFPLMQTFDQSSYKDDYRLAMVFANKKKGLRQVYTRVDGEHNKTFYLKGNHFVNRFGYCVLGYA